MDRYKRNHNAYFNHITLLMFNIGMFRLTHIVVFVARTHLKHSLNE